MGVDCYKIASFENTDLPLIRHVASKGKPLIISTGMMDLSEIDETVRAVKEEGCEDLILLKCTSTYPSTPENTNILTIPHMREMFDCEIGLSDHSMGIGVAVSSVAMGATVIEKHFTLDREDGGVDSAFSMEPEEMKSLVIESERAWLAKGKIKYGPTKKELNSRIYRRSLYITEDIKSGEKLTIKNLRAIRPGLGLPPKYIDKFLGKTLSKSVKKGTPLSWGIID